VKALLSTWHFGYPFFLTCCHSVFATIMTQLIYFFYPDWYVPLCSSVQLLFSSSLHRLPGVKSSQISVTMFFTKIVPIALFFSVSRRQRRTISLFLVRPRLRHCWSVRPAHAHQPPVWPQPACPPGLSIIDPVRVLFATLWFSWSCCQPRKNLSNPLPTGPPTIPRPCRVHRLSGCS
jgi:hypothetical protein